MNFKPFSIEITSEQEANAFAQILDWAVRHAGLQGATSVAVFQQKALEASKAAPDPVVTANGHGASAAPIN